MRLHQDIRQTLEFGIVFVNPTRCYLDSPGLYSYIESIFKKKLNFFISAAMNNEHENKKAHYHWDLAQRLLNNT